MSPPNLLIQKDNIFIFPSWKLEDRLQYVKPTEVGLWDFWKCSLLNFIANEIDLEYIKSRDGKFINCKSNQDYLFKLYEYLLNGSLSQIDRHAKSVIANHKSIVHKFYTEELQNAENLELDEKTKMYLEFLKSNTGAFRFIAREDNDYKMILLNYQVGFVDFANSKLNDSSIDFAVMRRDLDMLLTEARKTGLKLILKELEINETELETEFNQIFNFEFYHDPPILQTYNNQRIAYKKMLRAWLKSELGWFLKNMSYEDLPISIRLVNQFAENLLTKKELKEFEREQPGYKSYPEYIFSSYSAFFLFEKILNNLKDPSTAIFLYYHMKKYEHDEDFKIICSNYMFEDWFNAEDFLTDYLSLNSSTYKKTATHWRKAIYKLAADLLKRMLI